MNGLMNSFQVLMAPPAGGAGAESMLPTLLTFGAVFAIFYFLIIRPQNKKQKETQRMLGTLKKGDKVQTIGGIRGVVVSVKEDTIVVKVDDSAKLEFVRSAISGIIDSKETKEPKKGSGKKDKVEAIEEETKDAE